MRTWAWPVNIDTDLLEALDNVKFDIRITAFEGTEVAKSKRIVPMFHETFMHNLVTIQNVTYYHKIFYWDIVSSHRSSGW